MREVKIGDRVIGEGNSCFIIAEAGINHNGDITLAKKLIDVAKNAGADAVKFQTFKTENVLTRSAGRADYQKNGSEEKETQYEMIKKLELDKEHFRELAEYARKKDIIFLSSPFDAESVDLLCELDVPAFKVPSGEITNFPLLKYIAEKKKPIVLSTGMATLGEVEEAIGLIKTQGTEDIVLLHCISDYPARIEEVNLRAIKTLRIAFSLPVGFSDHTLSVALPAVAFALGACVIEKHFTLDKSLQGPDHKASLKPEELKKMIATIREVEKALGNGVKKPTEREEEIKKFVRRSIVAKRFIPEGTVITEDMLTFKRPGTGIEPKYLNFIIGRKSKQAIEKDELILMDKVR